MARLSNERLIDPKAIRKIGRAWGGTHWSADMARETGYSKSFITRAGGGTRSPDGDFLIALRKALIQRIADIAAQLTTEGMPHSGSVKTQAALAKINDAVKLLNAEHDKKAEYDKKRAMAA